MKTYTINEIAQEMTVTGSHWWDRDSMRCFGTRASEKVYQGTGGIYFVTSERPTNGSRAYSVRRYLPAGPDIETIGEFCSLTRAIAHRQAAELAGPQAVVVAEAHRPISAPEQLSIDIKRNDGRCTIDQASHLIRLATQYNTMMVDHCNGTGEVYINDEPSLKLAKLTDRIILATKRCGCGVKLSGDPRGCTVKLIMPSGETNDWGKEGWCVPTRN